VLISDFTGLKRYTRFAMNNIGAQLREAREQKGLSIDDVARETNIAKRYVEALEAEDFGKFPAEAYTVGFLKNYADFLALDVDALLEQYRALKVEEQPVPMDKLLAREKSGLPRVLVTCLVVAATAALVCGALFFTMHMTDRVPETAKKPHEPTDYVFENAPVDQRFYVGDSLIVSNGEDKYKVTLAGVANDAVTLRTPADDVPLALNQEMVLDLNDDGLPDVQVTVMDFAAGRQESGARLRFELANDKPPVAKTPAPPASAPAPDKTPPARVAATDSAIIWTGNNPFPFTLLVKFQTYCMFRWEVLREAGQGRKERYFTRGDEISIQAQNGVRLWISNAGAAKIQAISSGHTVQLDTGAAGEVAVLDVFWRRGDDGRFSLVCSRLEG
jgi:cytoskeletal protein RodZ